MSSNAMSGAAEPATTASADLADASRRLLEESFNSGNFELIDRFVAPDAVNHDPALPAQMRDLRGPDALRRIVTMYRAAFPDLRMTVDDVIASGDRVGLHRQVGGKQQRLIG